MKLVLYLIIPDTVPDMMLQCLGIRKEVRQRRRLYYKRQYKLSKGAN